MPLRRSGLTVEGLLGLIIRALIALLICGCFPAFAQAPTSTTLTHAISTNTTNPIPANSCIYVDQGPGTDTKLCSNWVPTLLGGSPLGVANGGTGLATWTTNAIPLGNGASSPTFLAPVNGDLLFGAGGLWTASSFSAALDAVFGSTQGGLLYRGVTLWSFLTPGTPGQFLETQGAGVNPLWANPTGSGTVGSCSTADALAYYAATGTVTSCLGSAGNSGQVLTSNGPGAAPTFQAPSGGGTSIVFTGGPTAGTSIAYTLATTTPGGFAFTNNYQVLTTFNAANGANPTLSVNGTTAAPIVGQNDSGLTPLVGGELQNNGQVYSLRAQTSCPAPISANCYVVSTYLPNGVTNTAGSPTVTAGLWAGGHFYTFTQSGQTLALPVSTTLSKNGGFYVNAIGSVTVQATSPDVICSAPAACGSAGGSALILPGTHTAITTDGAGHIYVPLGSSSGLTIATTSASGTGASPTAPQWQGGQAIVLNGASLTSTIPASTGLSGTGSVTIFAVNAGTLAATGSDTITYNNGSGPVTTSAGGTISLAPGSVTVVTTDAAGHLFAAGNLATSGASLVGNNSWLAGQGVSAFTLTDGSTITLNAASSNNFILILTGNSHTISNPTGLLSGQTITIAVTQDATGGRTGFALGSNFHFPGNVTPTWSTGANQTDVISCVAFTAGTANLHCTALIND